MSAPLHNVSFGSSRPFPLHATRVRVRGAPAAGDFLLHRQKKVTKEKATPVHQCPLRSSAKTGAAQLALRAQTVLASLPPF
jgi:hypothetical protein